MRKAIKGILIIGIVFFTVLAFLPISQTFKIKNYLESEGGIEW